MRGNGNCCVVAEPTSLLFVLNRFTPIWLRRRAIHGWRTSPAASPGGCPPAATGADSRPTLRAPRRSRRPASRLPRRSPRRSAGWRPCCSIRRSVRRERSARNCFWISLRSGSTVISKGETLSPCQIMIVVLPGDLPFRTTSCGETTTASAITGSETETRDASSGNCSSSPRPTVSVIETRGQWCCRRLRNHSAGRAETQVQKHQDEGRCSSRHFNSSSVTLSPRNILTTRASSSALPALVSPEAGGKERRALPLERTDGLGLRALQCRDPPIATGSEGSVISSSSALRSTSWICPRCTASTSFSA